MKMFFKLVKYDLKYGSLLSLKKILPVVTLFIFLCFEFRFNSDNFFEVNKINPCLTIGDFFLYCFAGMKEYEPSPLNPFVFPVKWMLIYVILFVSTLSYPYDNLTEFGQNILIRSGGRTLWWLSKCVWCVVCVILFFTISFLTIVVFCYVSGVEMSLTLSGHMPELLEMSNNLSPQLDKLLPAIFILPFIVMIALNLLQITLSMILKPLYSFGINLVLMLVSAYYLNPLLIGNYAMPVRSDKMISNGVSFSSGVFLSLVVIILSIAVGLLFFRKRNILKEEH